MRGTLFSHFAARICFTERKNSQTGSFLSILGTANPEQLCDMCTIRCWHTERLRARLTTAVLSLYIFNST